MSDRVHCTEDGCLFCEALRLGVDPEEIRLVEEMEAEVVRREMDIYSRVFGDSSGITTPLVNQQPAPRRRKKQQIALPDLSTRVFLSVEEAAAVIGLGRTKMSELVGKGVIFSVKEGRRRLVPVRALERYRESMEASECLDVATEKAVLPVVKMADGKRA